MLKAITDRTNLVLFALCALSILFATSCTATEVAAVTAGLGVAAAGILDAAAPLMTPAQFAEMRQGIEGLDGGIQATKTTIGVIVNAFESFRDAVQAKHEIIVANAQGQAVELATKASTGAAMGYAAAGGTGGTALSRLFSMVKHGVAPAPIRKAK